MQSRQHIQSHRHAGDEMPFESFGRSLAILRGPGNGGQDIQCNGLCFWFTLTPHLRLLLARGQADLDLLRLMVDALIPGQLGGGCCLTIILRANLFR